MVSSINITVALVDDHEMVTYGLRMALQVYQEIEVVGTASNVEDGCQLCQQFAPQVLITNKVMKHDNGSNLIQEVQRLSPTTQAFILGDFYEVERIVEALEAGARGYVLKQTSTLESIVKAIEAVAAGTWVFCWEAYALLPDKTAYQPYWITNTALSEPT